MFDIPHGDKCLLQSLGEFILHNGCKLEVVQLFVIERVQRHCYSSCENSGAGHLPNKRECSNYSEDQPANTVASC